MTAPTRPGRREAWISGVVIGVVSGLIFLVWPAFSFVIGGIFAVVAIVKEAPFGAGAGFAIGFGLAVLALLARATVACAQFNSAPGQECIAPDLTGLVSIGIASTIAGVSMTIALAAAWKRGR